VLQLYAASAGRRFGMLARDASAWGDPPASPAGALRTDVVGWREGESDWTGYCAFTHVRQEDGRLGIILNELMTVSPAAWRGLLLFLSTHNNVASIRWDAPGDEPLASVVREPRELEIKVCLDKMVRVLDVAELKFCCESDSRCPQGLTIGIHDRQAPWNDGRWRVEPAAGSRYALSREEGDIADASCEIAACDLGPIISGYLSIDGAVRAGLVKVSDDGAARQLRALFTRERAPYCPDNW
jgi:predicted acetyltransferase